MVSLFAPWCLCLHHGFFVCTMVSLFAPEVAGVRTIHAAAPKRTC
jgi:hypothetical protein